MIDSELRLWIYRHFIDAYRAPSLLETASHFEVTTDAVEQALHRLQTDAEAVVLIPGTGHIWMAEPFSAVPTSFLVRAGNRQWWGNCIWDGVAILTLLGLDGTVSTACPFSGTSLVVTVANGALVDAPGVVHFAVPARDWWRDIGFT
jgi:hypothetical protein